MSRRTLTAMVALLALVAAACGGQTGGTETTVSGGAEGEESDVIRFTFAPDPAWDWMKDQGILETMEQESGFRILQLATWDEFATFAGGHADVISTGTYETPLLEEQGIETVTFGQFNMNKDVLVTANPSYQTASDMPEGMPDRQRVGHRQHHHLGLVDQRARWQGARRGLGRPWESSPPITR